MAGAFCRSKTRVSCSSRLRLEAAATKELVRKSTFDRPLDNLESVALLTAKHFIGLYVIDKLLRHGVPLEWPPELHRDVAKMTSADATVLAFHVGDGHLS